MVMEVCAFSGIGDCPSEGRHLLKNLQDEALPNNVDESENVNGKESFDVDLRPPLQRPHHSSIDRREKEGMLRALKLFPMSNVVPKIVFSKLPSKRKRSSSKSSEGQTSNKVSTGRSSIT